MSGKTGIQWTDKVWNPLRGCTKVSPGCDSCYAMGIAHRFSGPGLPYEGLTRKIAGRGQWNGQVRFVDDVLEDPLRWKKPQRIFVNSMSDLFHENVPDEWIDKVFAVMALAPQHTFQVLTKRAERMRKYFDRGTEGIENAITEIAAGKHTGNTEHAIKYLGAASRIDDDLGPVVFPLPNVHLGVSVEDQPNADERIPELLATPAAVRWVSYEPALGPVEFLCDREWLMLFADKDRTDDEARTAPLLDWIVVGGESGRGARPFDLAWARTVIEQCKGAGVPAFVKQLGASPYDSAIPANIERMPAEVAGLGVRTLRLRDSHGGDISEFPDDLRVREFPR